MSLFAASRWGSILLLSGGWLAAADQPVGADVLSHLPEDEVASFSIGSVDRLKRRGDELIDAVGAPTGIRFSHWVPIALRWFGLERHFDGQRPISLIVTNVVPRTQSTTQLVLSVPLSNREAVARQAGVPPEERGVGPIKLSDESSSSFAIGALTDDRLLIGCHINEPVNPAAVESVLEAEKLSTRAGETVVHRFEGADLLLHLGMQELRRQSPEEFLPEKLLPLEGLEAEEAPYVQSAVAAALETKDLYFGLTLEDGLRLRQLLQFPADDSPASSDLLRDLRQHPPGGDETPAAGLRGLPAGPVLAAGATRLTSVRQQFLTRAILRLLYSKHLSLELGLFRDWPTQRLSDLRQSVFFGALAEVLPLTSEVRFAIYPSGEGHFATIVVLDTEDPERLVDTIRDLADELRPLTATDTATASDDEIRKLIEQLNAEDFAARNRAGTRLLIQGSRSLEWLDKAAESDDPATAARVKQLMAKLKSNTQPRAERLLTDNPWTDAHPRIVYQPGAETHAGLAVDVMRLDLPDEEQGLVAPLTEIFGPEWDRVRLARLPGQVVLSFGAAVPWLPETVVHCRDGRPGLARDSRLVHLEDDPHRLLELHLPLSRFVPEAEHRFFPDGEPKNQSPSLSLTGLGFSVWDRAMQFEVHVPAEEVRGMVVKRGWSW